MFDIFVVVLLLVLHVARYYVANKMMFPAQLDYNKRWSNSGYVKMVHKTRDSEAALGFDLTACECGVHKKSELQPPGPVKTESLPQPPRRDGKYLYWKLTREAWDHYLSTWRVGGNLSSHLIFNGYEVIQSNTDAYGMVLVMCRDHKVANVGPARVLSKSINGSVIAQDYEIYVDTIGLTPHH